MGSIDNTKHFMLSAVYVPTIDVARRVLLEEVQLCHSRFNLTWCIIGDFNEIQHPQERNWGQRIINDNREFNAWIEGLVLLELPLLNYKYT